MYVHTYILINLHEHISPYNTHTHTRTHAYTHTQTQTHRHTDTQTHKHTDTQTRRHADTQTHTHTHERKYYVCSGGSLPLALPAGVQRCASEPTLTTREGKGCEEEDSRSGRRRFVRRKGPM